VSQSPQGLFCDIFGKRSQLEYVGIKMIGMPHVHFNILMTTELGVVNSRFYKFSRLYSCKSLPNGQSSCLFEGRQLPF